MSSSPPKLRISIALFNLQRSDKRETPMNSIHAIIWCFSDGSSSKNFLPPSFVFLVVLLQRKPPSNQLTIIIEMLSREYKTNQKTQFISAPESYERQLRDFPSVLSSANNDGRIRTRCYPLVANSLFGTSIFIPHICTKKMTQFNIGQYLAVGVAYLVLGWCLFSIKY